LKWLNRIIVTSISQLLSSQRLDANVKMVLCNKSTTHNSQRVDHASDFLISLDGQSIDADTDQIMNQTSPTARQALCSSIYLAVTLTASSAPHLVFELFQELEASNNRCGRDEKCYKTLLRILIAPAANDHQTHQ
jgi:hypothetical protein